MALLTMAAVILRPPAFSHGMGPGAAQAHQGKPTRLRPSDWTKEYVESDILPHFPPLITGISGRIGAVVFSMTKEGKMTVRNAVKRTKPPSEKMLAQRDRFKEAAAYARTALADPTRRAIYEAVAAKRQLTSHTVAMADYLRVPVVEGVLAEAYSGRRGEMIDIHASDAAPLARLRVTIRNQFGRTLERSWIKNPAQYCQYVAKKDLSWERVEIEVLATDLAGNTGVLRVTRHQAPRATSATQARKPKRHMRRSRGRRGSSGLWFPEI